MLSVRQCAVPLFVCDHGAIVGPSSPGALESGDVGEIETGAGYSGEIESMEGS